MTHAVDEQAVQRAFTQGLLQAGRLWRRAADTVAKAHGISDATALPLVLVARATGPLRQTALAEAMGVEDPSLVRLLDQLCAAGLLARHEDPLDRRAKTLALTQAGRDLALQIEADLSALRSVVFAGSDPADFDGSLRLFKALAEYGRPAGLAADAGAAS